MRSWTDYFRVDVPDGTRGDWKVDRFIVGKDEAQTYNLSLIFGGQGARQIMPGTYVRLSHARRGVVMSTTPAELRDHLAPWQKAHGQVLINGLGLGAIAAACLRKDGPDRVERATVVEIDADVIALVAPTLVAEFGERVEIVHADALEWRPPKGARYGMVWHDVWDTITEDNREAMKRLHRRYGRLTTGWQGSWGKEEIDAERARDRRYASIF